MKKNLILIFVFSLISCFIYNGCEQEDYPYYVLTNDCEKLNPDIPPDPGGNPPEMILNNVKPSGVFSKEGGCRIKINMLGILDPATNTPITLVYKQNIFVTEDNILQGIKVTNLSENSQLLTDIVFTIDNSGSMGDEADSVAFKIMEYIDYLQSKGLNVRVGVVGYYGTVNGGINLTTGQNVKNFLNRAGYTSTSRTVGFAGPDSAQLQSAALAHGGPAAYSENAIVAITFADSVFSWRSNASRVYINFTDEPVQPSGQYWWSTKGFKDRWSPGKGTVHTVFSLDNSYWVNDVPDTAKVYSWTTNQYERPWGLSEATGGTVKIIHSDSRDLDLKNLPVTGALTASALIEFISKDPDAAHDVVIYVKHGNTVDGKTEYKGIKY